jgi:transcriptional regulator of arginine metabolism
MKGAGVLKNNRQTVILEIIATEEIETQNQLMHALERHGIKTTQATLSRDIRDMHLTKETVPGGGYRYVSVRRDTDDHLLRLRKIFKESVVSYDIAQNLFVIRTLPGLASAACSAMDAMKVEGLVGTLAGDDTAFLAMRDNAAAQRLYEEIRNLL